MPKEVDEMGELADKLITEGRDQDDEDIDIDDEDAPDADDDYLTIEDEPAVTEDFEQKYNVLKGKYDAETQRMTQMLSQTMAEKEALRLKFEANAPVRKEDTFDSDPDIQNIITEYPSLAKGIEKLASKIVAEKIKKTEAAVSERLNKTELDTYHSQLDAKVKDWRKINADPKFMEWLQVRDRYTGATRHELLMHSFNNFDAETSATFFSDYAKEKGLAVQSKKNAKETNMALDTAGNDLPPQGGKKTGYISRADITQFYRDRAMGKFQGSEETAAKIEARILRAVKEGKVR